jgi:hypothetical protein
MRWSVMLAAVLVLNACSGEIPTATEPASFFPRHGSPLGAGDAALLEGRITYVDGCLWVVAADGTRYLALWPADTTAGMINSLPAILGPDTELLIETGFVAQLAGSETDRPTAEGLVGPIPDRCAGDAFWVVGDVVNRPYGPTGNIGRFSGPVSPLSGLTSRRRDTVPLGQLVP